jgi:hypothetical protein
MTARTRLALAVFGMVALVAAPALGQQPRFYPDDPLRAEPAPLPVTNVQHRALSELLELVNGIITPHGQRQPADGVIEAQGVNTLGEVMDGDWYVNRHWMHRMTLDELQRGPGTDRPPAMEHPWAVFVVKPYGVNPGLMVVDEKQDLYLLRFDPPGHRGLATSAEIVTSRFLYALGYHVTENYLVDFGRRQLKAFEDGQTVSSSGKWRALVEEDIDLFLRDVPVSPDGAYRAVATRVPATRSQLLGPFQVWGTRSDDPNDVVPHEHRRDLRGLFVFYAWLNNTKAEAVDTQDIVVTVDGVSRLRHFLVDFTGSLGSSAREGPKTAWEGREASLPSFSEIRGNMLGLGIFTRDWMRARYPTDLPDVGRFDGATFDPEAWKTAYPIAPFENRLPDDTFWAARQVMAFSDDEIRAIVRTGQYGQEAEDWITNSLIERRNRIGRLYFARVLPLDAIRVSGDSLQFEDLGVEHGFATARSYTIEWRGFDNAANRERDLLGTGPDVPAGARALEPGGYAAVRIHAGDPAMRVTAYLRRTAGGFDVVGLDRSWPGKVVVAPPKPASADVRVYDDLSPRQQKLFETYVNGYNTSRGVQLTPQQAFVRLTLSEQSTFYAITHALSHSALTDQDGAPLGMAIDRIAAVERVAGQYAGKGGDEQFRLYVRLEPGTRDVLEKSREFFKDHENTVYHIGYPHSYRQIGKEPNMQFSLSEDGLRADIDVDYRSSKSPQALFNGHLTAANSDVRVGDNTQRHNGRWGGLVAWWQDFIGHLHEPDTIEGEALGLNRPDVPTPTPPDRPAGAEPERIEDATQEFLSDWLVRHEYDQALQFLSPRSYACLNLTDNARDQSLDAAASRRELLTLMKYSAGRLTGRRTLTDAIEAFTPRDPKRPVVDHAFKREFLVTPMSAAEAAHYMCDEAPPDGPDATYFGVAFRFRVPTGADFGLLWTKEQGHWRLIAYQALKP